MAADIVSLMRHLGHERFAVVGHDRGSYVALRVALDHPEVASRLVVLDSVPIGEALARADAKFASAWWHWFFLGQTANPAERVINADPDVRGTEATLRYGRTEFRRSSTRHPRPGDGPRHVRRLPGWLECRPRPTTQPTWLLVGRSDAPRW